LTKFLSSWLVLEALVASTFSRPFEMIARTADSFDGIPDPVLLIDNHGLVMQVNRAGRQWLGVAVPELVGRPLVDVLRLDPGATSTLTLCKAIRERISLQDLEAVDQGRQRTILFSMAPFWDSTQDAIMVVSLRDITQRRSIERALEVAKQRSEMALINGDQGLWDWNIRSGEVFFSPTMESMLGYPEGSWKPHVSAWERLIHPDDLPRVMSDLSSHLDGTSAQYDNTHRLRHKDGHWVWVRDRGRVIERDHNGQPLRAIGTHSDVSTSIAREVRLSSANAELQSFAYGISHDLKGPLRVISEQIHLAKKCLAEGAPPGTITPVQHHLDHARNGADHLKTMIDGLLDYARIDSEEVSLVPIDLNRLCVDAIRSQDTMILQTNAQICQGPSFPLVLGDPVLLRRVISTVIDNALKFHRPGQTPSISLNAWQEGQKVVLEIADQGLGLAPQDTHIIFEMFKRGSGVDHIPGLGIGLAIAKRSVERMNGTLAVRLDQTMGTTFMITLSAPQGPLQILAAVQTQSQVPS
jgi:PAS domain S-box-containing protein